MTDVQKSQKFKTMAFSNPTLPFHQRHLMWIKKLKSKNFAD